MTAEKAAEPRASPLSTANGWVALVVGIIVILTATLGGVVHTVIVQQTQVDDMKAETAAMVETRSIITDMRTDQVRRDGIERDTQSKVDQLSGQVQILVGLMKH